MQTSNVWATRITELVMATLRGADVLKPDAPNYPTHYNRAYTAVYEVLRQDNEDTIKDLLDAMGK